MILGLYIVSDAAGLAELCSLGGSQCSLQPLLKSDCFPHYSFQSTGESQASLMVLSAGFGGTSIVTCAQIRMLHALTALFKECGSAFSGSAFSPLVIPAGLAT